MPFCLVLFCFSLVVLFYSTYSIERTDTIQDERGGKALVNVARQIRRCYREFVGGCQGVAKLVLGYFLLVVKVLLKV